MKHIIDIFEVFNDPMIKRINDCSDKYFSRFGKYHFNPNDLSLDVMDINVRNCKQLYDKIDDIKCSDKYLDDTPVVFAVVDKNDNILHTYFPLDDKSFDLCSDSKMKTATKLYVYYVSSLQWNRFDSQQNERYSNQLKYVENNVANPLYLQFKKTVDNDIPDIKTLLGDINLEGINPDLRDSVADLIHKIERTLDSFAQITTFIYTKPGHLQGMHPSDKQNMTTINQYHYRIEKGIKSLKKNISGIILFSKTPMDSQQEVLYKYTSNGKLYFNELLVSSTCDELYNIVTKVLSNIK